MAGDKLAIAAPARSAATGAHLWRRIDGAVISLRPKATVSFGDQRLFPFLSLQLPEAEADHDRDRGGDDERGKDRQAHQSLIRPSRALCRYSNTRHAALARRNEPDRKSVVEGKSVSVRLDLGGRRFNKKKKKKT